MKTKVKRRIKYKNVFIFLLIIIAIFVSLKIVINRPVTNIYISGNSYIKDIDILRETSLIDYPSISKVSISKIKKILDKNTHIISSKVSKKGTKVYIEIEENTPLFYDSNTNLLVMADKSKIKSDIKTPYLVNYIPDTIYEKFIDEISKVNKEVINRISDIEYKPNNVDTKRFYLTMTDGNYVYVTLDTFSKINDYVSMLKQLHNKKGILYLDSGEYFEIKD